MQYAQNYSVAKFLSTENYNYSISQWIPSSGVNCIVYEKYISANINLNPTVTLSFL